MSEFDSALLIYDQGGGHRRFLGADVQTAWALRGWPRRAPRRLAPTWTCGMLPSSRFDYTATAFAKPLRVVFATIYRPRREVVRETGANPYVVRRLRYTGEVVDLADFLNKMGAKIKMGEAVAAVEEKLK